MFWRDRNTSADPQRAVWKELLLECYFQCGWPWRSRVLARLGQLTRAPVLAVFYHRVANTHPNPWTISESMFVSHLQWMKRHFEFVSLSEAQRRIRSNANPKPCVAITFDDGYADNIQFALPYLIEHQIPATYFVTTHHILEQQPFPHDVARGQPLGTNTIAELRTIARQGIEIGAHTRYHADMGKVTDANHLYDELVVAAADLQRALGEPIRYFAFPYGQHSNLNSRAIELAYETGFEGVCSAYGGYNWPGDDAFHIQRIPGDTPLVYLKNWLTLDGRKLRSVRRFQYQRYCLPTPSQEQVAS